MKPDAGHVGVVAGEPALSLLQTNVRGDASQRGQAVADLGLVGGAGVVEILGVARGLRQVQLVQAGAAAEGQLAGEQLVGCDLDDQSGEDQVLLDLTLAGQGAWADHSVM